MDFFHWIRFYSITKEAWAGGNAYGNLELVVVMLMYVLSCGTKNLITWLEPVPSWLIDTIL